ncbi:unnamed protein product [Phytophthora fragariaefolia]|uniref:Unnamed protein product n=1 Tax=Phytophthora fragariaefolia TaxID=1490495 RepID=A0A9W6X556_9STRA|nr:unnamed protein product [Phytophthora fragariaefolia]
MTKHHRDAVVVRDVQRLLHFGLVQSFHCARDEAVHLGGVQEGAAANDACLNAHASVDTSGSCSPEKSSTACGTVLRSSSGMSGSSKWRHCVVFTGTTGTTTAPTLPSIAGTSLEDPASRWFLFWASRAPVEEQTWAQFTQDVLAHFEASNYQAVLRQKLRQLRQVDDIEYYTGKHSALIFYVENMSEVDQVSYYCAGLKRTTQAYVKQQCAVPMSEATDQAAKYEMAHFGGDRKTDREEPKREQRFRGKPSTNHSQDKKLFSVHSSLVITHLWSKVKRPGKSPATPVEEGPVVVRTGEVNLTVNEATPNPLCEDHLVYNRAPLFAEDGDLVQSDEKFKIKFLLDCCATTVYVSRDFVNKHELETYAYPGRTIRMKLGDNKIGEAVPELAKINIRPKGVPKSTGNVDVSRMTTSGTLYITRKKLRKFLRLHAKGQPKHDFTIVLKNDTIKAIDRDIKRNDELEIHPKPTRSPGIKVYNENLFMPELPDELSME